MLKVKTEYDYREEAAQALESGNYKQAYQPGICINNVGCALAVIQDALQINPDSMAGEGAINYAGIIRKLKLPYNGGQHECAPIWNMNDEQRKSFKEIAKWIRELP